MRAKTIILKALKRRKRELRITNPNNSLSESHMQKADHNLVVMTDLEKFGHEDWIVIVAYYAMYHSALAVLSKIGLDSKDHATTVAVLEYFFGEQIEKDLLKEFRKLKDKKEFLEEKYIDYLWKMKSDREKVQYGVSINYKETNKIIKNSRDFVTKIKLLLEELDEKIISVITKEIKDLKESAKSFSKITKSLKESAKKAGFKEREVSGVINRYRTNNKND